MFRSTHHWAHRPRLALVLVLLVGAFGVAVWKAGGRQEWAYERDEPPPPVRPPPECPKPKERRRDECARPSRLAPICPSDRSKPLVRPKKCIPDFRARLRRMRDVQHERLAYWRALELRPELKWMALVGTYDSSEVDFGWLYTFLSDGERKYFLDFVERDAPCRVFTLGVGADFSGETGLSNRYPQCEFVAVDPDAETNRPLVERLPTARFVQAVVGAAEGNFSASIRGANGRYERQTVAHREIAAFLDEQGGRERPIDLLLVDVEGAEFRLLPKLLDAQDRLPAICQLNAEVHFPPERFGLATADALAALHRFLADGPFTVFNMDSQKQMLRLFLVNAQDERCVEKFFC
ncbi:Protein of unknown function DUF13 domain containing protein [Aphelenchoides fujianensis]|nr:Protein of unknown function DUF13 domain containing protein [Aphelenchoides fujianensis]